MTDGSRWSTDAGCPVQQFLAGRRSGEVQGTEGRQFVSLFFLASRTALRDRRSAVTHKTTPSHTLSTTSDVRSRNPGPGGSRSPSARREVGCNFARGVARGLPPMCHWSGGCRWFCARAKDRWTREPECRGVVCAVKAGCTCATRCLAKGLLLRTGDGRCGGRIAPKLTKTEGRGQPWATVVERVCVPPFQSCDTVVVEVPRSQIGVQCHEGAACAPRVLRHSSIRGRVLCRRT